MEEYEENGKKDEILIGDNKPVPMNIANKVMKSICKIIIKGINKNNIYGTGFFMKISNSLKFLITNYHVICPNVINQNIEVEIWDQKKMKLNISNRYIKYFEKPKDITIIKIKDTDSIYNDIEFLGYDSNYINGYNIYKNNDIFTVQYPLGKDAVIASGIIVDIDGYEFDHNISTDEGSSGCPIILLNNNINLIQVIGIHKSGSYDENINSGTFIGELINYINNNINIVNKPEEKNENNDNAIINLDNNKYNNILNLKSTHELLENENNNIDEEMYEFAKKLSLEENNKKIEQTSENYIIAEIYINENNINNEIRILNSFEEWVRSQNKNQEKDYKNEKEIKECEIKINNKLIPFSYKYKFTKHGKYKIKYTFKNLLTNTVLLFAECSCLSYIDLSHFYSKNVTNVYEMFMNCTSLENINLTNFNTQNVEIFQAMFSTCKALTDINLTSFNTKKAVNMRNMFAGCSSLQFIDLSTFNTENVTDMSGLFMNCSKLEIIILSNINTKNVTDMSFMFSYCNSLSDIDLSNFNTQKVTNMNFMFAECNSIKYLNLSSFTTKSSTKFDAMFNKFKFIKGGKIIANDIRIKQKIEETCNLQNSDIYNNIQKGFDYLFDMFEY